jgi:hypothetical protein
MTEVFFGTAFTGPHQNTTPASAGRVAGTGEVFCAELPDSDQSLANDWS